MAVILLVATAVHARGLSGGLTYDDHLLIARNPAITDLANLPRLFTTGYWDFQGAGMAGQVGYWRPLTSVVFALVWKFAGSASAAYHAVSLAIHLCAAAATYLLARRLGGSAWIAAGTALLFALHPAQVESVAWISAVNDPLWGLLVLLALERFLAWRARGSRGIPLVAAISFLLALLAKETAVALVPLVVAIDVLRPPAGGEVSVPPESWASRVRATLSDAPVRAYGAFAAVLAVYVLARMLVFASPWAGLDRGASEHATDALRLAQLRVEVFGGALEILAIPLELDLFRLSLSAAKQPLPEEIDAFDPRLVRAAVFTAVFLALLAASLRGRKRLALAALLVVLAGLVPVLVQAPALGAFPLAERYLYLSVSGFALGTALFLDHALPRRAATVLLVALAALYGVRSYTRIGVWRDEETLYRDAAQRSPDTVFVQHGLGRALLQRLDQTGDPRYLVEAGQAFERAARLLAEAKERGTGVGTSFDYLQVNLGLAWCEIAAGDHSAAILMLQELVRRIEEIRTREAEARARGLRVGEQFLDLERVYVALAVAQSGKGEVEEAARSLARALELQPDSAEAHAHLGRLYATAGRWPDAEREFETAARLRPGVAEDRVQLANALQMQGKDAQAEALGRELLAELPGRTEPLVLLAVAALKRGDSAEGLTWIERALALEPRDSHAWYQKACALMQRGDRLGALSAFRNATDIDPANFVAHHDCAGFLLAEGLIAEAQPYLVRAYTLAPPQHRAALRKNLVQMELDGATLRELARADAERGEHAAALHWLDDLLVREPGLEEALLERARALRRLGRDEEALAGFRAAAERAPASFEVWSELGSYLHALGRRDEARPVLERALELERPRGLPEEVWKGSREALRGLIERGK